MTYLETLNYEKSFAVIKDYFSAFDSPGIHPDKLLEKKQMAVKASEHLTVIINDENGVLRNCDPDVAGQASCSDCDDSSQR